MRKAYSKNPEFYAFYRSLQAYERSLGKDGDLLVVTPGRRVLQVSEGPGQAEVMPTASSHAQTPDRQDARPVSLNLSDLLAAIGLFLVLEGIAPFINPGGVKRGLARLLQVRDRELRIAGLGSMLVGVIILFIAR